jgi:ABC-2 type transport system permease protein
MSGKGILRLRGLLRKESLQIARDPSSLAIAVLLPVMMLLLFGYGVSLDAKHVPVALVVEQPNRDTASFIGAFYRSPYFAPVRFATIQQADRAMAARRVDAIVWLRSNFVRQMLSVGKAPIGLLVNGIDSNTARIVQGYVQQVWINWLLQRVRAEGASLKIPVNADYRIWFNPAVRSRDYLVPGLIAVIMTLTGVLLTAMVVAREWERGTLEALMVTPVSIREVVVSKLVPYFVLGMAGTAVSVAMAVWLFNIPLRSSLAVLAAGSALFMLAALGMGLLISVVAKNQFVAGQMAITFAFLPAWLLSGFVFDIHSMPRAIQFITRMIAARYFVSILQTTFLAGDVWSVLLPNAFALIIMAVVFLGLARVAIHKRLE